MGDRGPVSGLLDPMDRLHSLSRCDANPFPELRSGIIEGSDPDSGIQLILDKDALEAVENQSPGLAVAFSWRKR